MIKEAIFAELKSNRIKLAKVSFSGGNDEGSAESVTIIHNDGYEEYFHYWGNSKDTPPPSWLKNIMDG
ncbi:MAG: hypothetical protein FJZ43_04835, partial [Candidatus Staskawiczbacteria bacterium]|nr:hypothetical protein [Candidatus Staskawiczbacteria bacterium]